METSKWKMLFQLSLQKQGIRHEAFKSFEFEGIDILDGGAELIMHTVNLWCGSHYTEFVNVFLWL